MPVEERIGAWLADVEARHMEGLAFPQVRQAVQALSADYVEKRERLQADGYLSRSGKRAAFALFYGPLHFFAVREIVRSVGAGDPTPAEIVDLGCGTGVAGAAWALEETCRTWRALGLSGKTVRADLSRCPLPPPRERRGPAAGMDHRRLTARSLYLPGPSP